MTDERESEAVAPPNLTLTTESVGIVRVGPLTIRPQRQIYALIIVLSTLAVGEDSGDPVGTAIAFLTAIMVAPLLAMMMAHAFSEAASRQIALGRRLTWRERRHLVRENTELVWVGVVFSILLVPFALTDMSVDEAVDTLSLIGLAALFAWGYVVGAHARLSRVRRVLMATSYALLGLLIILIEAAAHHLDEIVLVFD